MWVLGPFLATVGYGENKFGKFFFLWTHRSDIFIPYYSRFYSRGKTKKFLTLEAIHDLDPRGLAYWYMDDGKFHEYGAYLCVGKISVEEGAMLVKFLKDRFNLESTLQVQDIKRGYYNIYIKAESRPHFFDLINSFIISSMQYKIIGRGPDRLDYNREQVLERHLDMCRASNRLINFSGDLYIQKEVSDKAGQVDFKRRYIETAKSSFLHDLP
jgi:LAGLIDADG DNA endonuclease family